MAPNYASPKGIYQLYLVSSTMKMRQILFSTLMNQTGSLINIFEGRNSIGKLDLIDDFTSNVLGYNNDNALNFSILYYIYTFVLFTKLTGATINRIDFDLVKPGRYKDYPLGDKAFDCHDPT